MQSMKKAAQARAAQNENRSRCKDSDFSAIFEQRPDILQDFTRLRKIAETRQNPRIKATMLATLQTLFFAFEELLRQVQQLYAETERHKINDLRHRAVITALSEDTGTDPNLTRDWLRLRAIVQNQIENLKRKGLIDG